MIYQNIGVWAFIGSLMLSIIGVAEPFAQSQPFYRAKQVAQLAHAEQVHPQKRRLYNPPQRDELGGRFSDIKRGRGCAKPIESSGKLALQLFTLVPDHTGLTTYEQPSLYWYLSMPTICPVELTVSNDQAIMPLLETRLDAPAKDGVQQIRLADYGVRLELDVPYRWFVTLIVNEMEPSQNPVAGGIIERIGLSDSLRRQLAQASKREAPLLYAQAGVWYDALTTLSQLIEGAPYDAGLQQRRAALLAEVGLNNIALRP